MSESPLSRRTRRAGVIALSIMVGVTVVGVAGSSHADPASAPTTSDFDGDGVDDLAMAAENASGGEEAVVVDYSSSLASQKLSPYTAYGTEGFGVGLAAGDLDDDGIDDLAVGCVDCDWEWSGPTVSIFRGSPQGLTVDTAMEFEVNGANFATAIGELDGRGPADVASTREGFYADVTSWDGSAWRDKEYEVSPPLDVDYGRIGAVAIGDVNGDGKDDLVLGSPVKNGGAVTVFDGPVSSAKQRTVKGTELSPTLRDLGASLAVADVNGDGFDDIVAGAPTSTTGGTSCGAIQLLLGSAKGISPEYGQRVNQDTAKVPGVCESGDRWGAVVAAADLEGDLRTEVLVGVPGEAIGELSKAGAYTVLQPNATGLTGSGSFSVLQSTANVPGKVEAGDGFGSALAVRDVNGDNRSDVLIGAPGEDVGSAKDAGQVVTALSNGNGVPGVGTSEVTGDQYGLKRLGWKLA